MFQYCIDIAEDIQPLIDHHGKEIFSDWIERQFTRDTQTREQIHKDDDDMEHILFLSYTKGDLRTILDLRTKAWI